VEKTVQRGALCSVLHAKYYSADNIRNNVMGGTCGTYGVQCYGVET
jgi:hypothetical protein